MESNKEAQLDDKKANEVKQRHAKITISVLYQYAVCSRNEYKNSNIKQILL